MGKAVPSLRVKIRKLRYADDTLIIAELEIIVANL